MHELTMTYELDDGRAGEFEVEYMSPTIAYIVTIDGEAAREPFVTVLERRYADEIREAIKDDIAGQEDEDRQAARDDT